MYNPQFFKLENVSKDDVQKRRPSFMDLWNKFQKSQMSFTGRATNRKFHLDKKKLSQTKQIGN